MSVCWLGHPNTYISSSNRLAWAHSQDGGHRISKTCKRGQAPMYKWFQRRSGLPKVNQSEVWRLHLLRKQLVILLFKGVDRGQFCNLPQECELLFNTFCPPICMSLATIHFLPGSKKEERREIGNGCWLGLGGFWLTRPGRWLKLTLEWDTVMVSSVGVVTRDVYYSWPLQDALIVWVLACSFSPGIPFQTFNLLNETQDKLTPVLSLYNYLPSGQ